MSDVLDVLSCSCENKTQATWTVKDEIYLGSEGRFDFLHSENIGKLSLIVQKNPGWFWRSIDAS